MSDQHPEFEEIEQIPWSALAARTKNPLGRVGYAIAGVIVAVVIGLFAARWLATGEGVTVVTLPDTDPGPVAATTTAAAPLAERAPASEEGVPAAVADSAVYSEADLMAISVEDEARLAAMRAEWFVQDYFTVDGDERAAGDLADVLGGDLAVPHRDPAGYSYVEWARAFAVTNSSPGRYGVAVAYRTLVPSGEMGFARTAVRAVTVTIDVDVDGTTRLADLPSPASLPASLPMAVVPGESAAASEEITADVLRGAAEIGSNPVIVDVTRDGNTWRFVVQISDESGNRWPVVVAKEGP
jgi:hypothetical protein